MKVKIQQRSVYHKFAEVEVEVPDNVTAESLGDYLIDNDFYSEKMDKAISKADYEFGFGTNSDSNSYNNSHFTENESESEWRYDCKQLKVGGHL